jgi:sugar O-acyltransferase (sialic acid O-acetyltransferase NeuD family)
MDFRQQELIIFGGGGQGKTLIDLVRALGIYQLVGVVDDGIPAGTEILGVPVLGGAAVLPGLRERGVGLALNAVGGIGNVDVRLKVFDLLQEAGFAFPTVIHPTAFIEPSAEIDEGVQVLPLTYIGSAAKIGFGALINSHVIISHDCVIGRVVNLSPGAMLAGGVRVDDFAQIGMGATVNLNLTVGTRARVGNGATVKSDVPTGGRVYAGCIWPERSK